MSSLQADMAAAFAADAVVEPAQQREAAAIERTYQPRTGACLAIAAPFLLAMLTALAASPSWAICAVAYAAGAVGGVLRQGQLRRLSGPTARPRRYVSWLGIALTSLGCNAFLLACAWLDAVWLPAAAGFVLGRAVPVVRRDES